MAVRNFTNNAPPQALTSGISNSTVTIPVASTAGYPTAPFLLAAERGTANAEVMLCTAKAANSFTVTRGFDSTTGVAHDVGTFVEHCSTAIDYAEANAHANTPHLNPTVVGAAGDMFVASADDAIGVLSVTGTINYALLADPAEPLKMKWADIGMGVWTAYTPAWIALTSGTPLVGNGGLAGRYKLIGKTCHFYFTLAIGTTTYGAFGPWVFGHPPGCVPYQSGLLFQWGQAYVNKVDVAMQASSVLSPSGITILVPDNSPVALSNNYVQSGPGGYPSTWVNGDFLRVWGTMEVV